MTKNMQFNHQQVVENIASEIPTYILRYEDLLTDPEPALIECFKFLLDAPTIEGTVVEKRIKDISRSGFASKSVYKLKDASSHDLIKNRHMYSDEQMEELRETLADYNLFYGYTNKGDEESRTEFFEYPRGSLTDE